APHSGALDAANAPHSRIMSTSFRNESRESFRNEPQQSFRNEPARSPVPERVRNAALEPELDQDLRRKPWPCEWPDRLRPGRLQPAAQRVVPEHAREAAGEGPRMPDADDTPGLAV